jgi:hypothetical protein
MRHARMGYRRMISGVRRLRAAGRLGRRGVLAGLLLLPRCVGPLGSGDLDTSFDGDGKVLPDFGSGSQDWATPWSFSPMARSWQPAIPVPVATRALPWRVICPRAPWIPPSAAMLSRPLLDTGQRSRV